MAVCIDLGRLLAAEEADVSISEASQYKQAGVAKFLCLWQTELPTQRHRCKAVTCGVVLSRGVGNRGVFPDGPGRKQEQFRS